MLLTASLSAAVELAHGLVAELPPEDESLLRRGEIIPYSVLSALSFVCAVADSYTTDSGSSQAK